MLVAVVGGRRSGSRGSYIRCVDEPGRSLCQVIPTAATKSSDYNAAGVVPMLVDEGRRTFQIP